MGQWGGPRPLQASDLRLPGSIPGWSIQLYQTCRVTIFVTDTVWVRAQVFLAPPTQLSNTRRIGPTARTHQFKPFVAYPPASNNAFAWLFNTLFRGVLMRFQHTECTCYARAKPACRLGN